MFTHGRRVTAEAKEDSGNAVTNECWDEQLTVIAITDAEIELETTLAKCVHHVFDEKIHEFKQYGQGVSSKTRRNPARRSRRHVHTIESPMYNPNTDVLIRNGVSRPFQGPNVAILPAEKDCSR
jgi:hypothetical protein